MLENFATLKYFHLDSPWFLVLLPVLILALVVAFARKRPSVIVSSLKPYIPSLTKNQRLMSPIKLPIILESLGLLLFVVALVRPQHGIEETIKRAKGIDLMLALDISGSMESYDIPKGVTSQKKVVTLLNSGKLNPRIDVAKEEVKKFIDKRPNDRIGLVGFAANTYTVCPPTLDHNFLKSHLERLQAGMLPDGTGIAAPIGIATSRLKDSTAKRRVFVLFTDGDNNVDSKITPLQAANIAGSFDIVIHTVGIGSNRAFVIRPGFFGRQQMVNVEANFNEELLSKISEVSTGQYFSAEDAEGFKNVMKSIDALEKTTMEQPTFVDYRDLYRGWLECGLLMLVLGFFMENTISLKIP